MGVWEEGVVASQWSASRQRLAYPSIVAIQSIHGDHTWFGICEDPLTPPPPIHTYSMGKPNKQGKGASGAGAKDKALKALGLKPKIKAVSHGWKDCC